jgi:hypothetical protein
MERSSARLLLWIAGAGTFIIGSVAACSSSSHADAPDAAVDAGPDVALPDTAPLPDDAAPDAPSATTCDQDLASDGLWGHLRCTGLYSDFAAKTVDPANAPYAPALQLWSDGAEKQRWLYLPPGQKIDTSGVDEWVFPNGTKVWKEFKVDGKRVETRLYFKGTDGEWRHTTYVWSADDSDAVRKDGGQAVPRADGGAPYQIPNAVECNDCHAGRKDKLLGVEPGNLALPGAQGIKKKKKTTEKQSYLVEPDAGGATYFILKRGDPSASLVSVLSGRRVAPTDPPNTYQMPPIVTRLVDTKGHQLLDDWITLMP